MSANNYSSKDIFELRKPNDSDPRWIKRAEKAIKNHLKKPSSTCFESFLISIFPFISIFKSCYSLNFLISDVISGTTMFIFNIPQGMAYGLLSGLSPINGLYTSLYPPLVYFLFGTCRHLAIGTFAVTSLLISESIIRVSDQYEVLNKDVKASDIESNRLIISTTLTFFVGLIQLLFGVLRLGFLVCYMPTPVLRGFTCACSFYVVQTQIDAILGIKSERAIGIGQFFTKTYNIGMKIKNINFITMGISIAALVFLITFKEFIFPRLKIVKKIPIPLELIMLIIASLVSYFSDFNGRYDVQIIGYIPTGFPTIVRPHFELFGEIVSDAFRLAILSYAISASISKHYAAEFRYEVNYSQEWTAFGLVNIITAPFNCFVASAALARTAVVVEAGMKTQIASLVNSALMLLVLFVMGPLLAPIPKCVLSCAILVALKTNILQLRQFPLLIRAYPIDGFIWIISFASTICLNIPLGLIVSVTVALMTVILRCQICRCDLLGRFPGTQIYLPVARYNMAEHVDYMKIVSTRGPVFFPNSSLYKKAIFKCVGIFPLIEYQRRESDSLKKQKTNKQNLFKSCLKKRKSPNLNGVSDNDSFQNDIRDVETNEEILYLTSPSMPRVHAIVIDCHEWTIIDLATINFVEELIDLYGLLDIRVFLSNLSDWQFNKFQKKKLDVFIDSSSGKVMHRIFPSIHEAVVYVKKELKLCNIIQ